MDGQKKLVQKGEIPKTSRNDFIFQIRGFYWHFMGFKNVSNIAKNTLIRLTYMLGR